MVEGAALEMRCTERYRGFESLSLRHFFFAKKMANEAARLHFTVPSGTTSLKSAAFSSHLHQIPEALLACPAIASATADEDAPFHSACEDVSLTLHL